MPHTVSYKNQDPNESTFTVGHDKDWTNLTKEELMEIPWIKEAIKNPDGKLFINGCMGFSIDAIYEDGSILANDDLLYIAKNHNPGRFLLKEMRYNEGVYEPSSNGPCYIQYASVIGCFERYGEVGVLCETSNKYHYKSDGTMTKQILPF